MEKFKSLVSPSVSTAFFLCLQILGVLAMAPAQALSAEPSEPTIQIATFDSGFGGYFTAKSIETKARALSESYRANFHVSHFGDTLNIPYGEKTPEQIAQFAAKGIQRAQDSGAEVVFIACNTASTQFDRIKEILDAAKPGSSKSVLSIIEQSVLEVKRQLDGKFLTKKEVNIGIFATPATIRSMAYPKAIAKIYGAELPASTVSTVEQERWYQRTSKTIQSAMNHVELSLPDQRLIHIYQMGPANWVDLIEHGAQQYTKDQILKRDVELLTQEIKKGTSFDVVGEFCTHYPALERSLMAETNALHFTNAKTGFIKQGPLMGNLFESMMKKRLAKSKRQQQLSQKQKTALAKKPSPQIFISGSNIEETKQLTQTIFPDDPAPIIKQIAF